MHVQNCCLAHLNLLLFLSSRFKAPSWVWGGCSLHTVAGLLPALCHQSSFLHLGRGMEESSRQSSGSWNVKKRCSLIQHNLIYNRYSRVIEFKYNNNIQNLPPNGGERWIFSSSPCWAFASWWSLFSVATNKQSDWLFLQKQKQATLAGPWIWCARWYGMITTHNPINQKRKVEKIDRSWFWKQLRLVTLWLPNSIGKINENGCTS